jgi:PHS family inorganic phosphate transporter-like MFS transporter
MEIFALFMFCGLLISFLIPETKRKTLEELAGEVPGTSNYDPALAGHGQREYSVGSEEVSSDGKERGETAD